MVKPIFDTSKLDQLLAHRSRRNETERQELLKKVLQWLNQHGTQYGIRKAYIFGSLTQAHQFHRNSDIDLAIEQTNPATFFSVIGYISEAMGRDVDLIQLDKCHFADRIRQAGIQWTAID